PRGAGLQLCVRVAHAERRWAASLWRLCALAAIAVVKVGPKGRGGAAGSAAYPTLPGIFDLVGSSSWLAKFTPSMYMATCPCMNAALHSYQLKLTTPGGANRRSMPAYHSMLLTHPGVLIADFRSGVRYSPPMA